VALHFDGNHFPCFGEFGDPPGPIPPDVVRALQRATTAVGSASDRTARDQARLWQRFGIEPRSSRSVPAVDRVLITAADVERRVAQLGAEISRDYTGPQPVLVGVLRGVGDVGVGTRTVLAMIAAEVLGVPYETVGVRAGDTDLPYAPMQAGSRITFSMGWAVKAAAEDARAQILKLAEALIEMPSAELEIKGGRVKGNGAGEKGHSLAELFSFAGRESRVVGHAKVAHEAKPALQGFGAHFVELEVDTETGDVNVLRYVAAHDVGRALNPHGVENQIYGLGQTLGQALTEDLIFDEANGLTLNPDLSQYLMPTVKDFPPIDVVMVETNDPLGPFGAKGIGEPPLPPVLPAIANAIYNAIGIRFNTLPITRDNILNALHEE